jgi:heparan-alpha-glucosaminide N-acetyltransferase
MATVAESISAPAPLRDGVLSGSGRLLSLDAFRGLIMITLIGHGFGFGKLAGVDGWAWLARQVDHVAWEGVTFWDLIQPAFTFMVGVAMPLSIARRKREGASFGELFRHVAWRALVLIVLSNVLSNWNAGKPGVKLQYINVLSQIGLGYFVCFLILQLRFAWQVAAGAGLLLGHWALFTVFAGPEGGQRIDMWLLGYHYAGYYTTINFIGNAATILFGCWAGMLLSSPRTDRDKLRILLAAAAAGFAGGLLLELFVPMVKRLWTAPFALFSAGWVVLMLAAIYWAVELQGWRRWTFAPVVVGMNSIFIYSFSQVLYGWLNRGLAVFTGNFWYLGVWGHIAQALTALAAMWGMCFWLYRRKIFFKI